MEQIAPTIILILSVVVFFFWLSNSSKAQQIEERRKAEDYLRRNHGEEINKLASRISEFEKENHELLLESQKLRNFSIGLQRVVDEKSVLFPWLASAFADYHLLLGKKEENTLRYKSHPARKAADVVKEASARAADAERRFRLLKYRLMFYEKCFPWINDVSSETIDELLEAQYLAPSEDLVSRDADPVSNFLAPAEYNSLPVVVRNQRALDRWKSGKKSSWEIGRIYERYVGYRYEVDGWKVEYFGAIKGFDDLGRDLIARRKGLTKIIQCKYWAASKTIHEKHIFQLFGTVVEYIARQNKFGQSLPLFGAFEKLSDVNPVFVTSASLSPTARDFAKILGVEVIENHPLEEYPLIKCNISKRDGEKVYHLPFDQQYDRTVIEPSQGEFYASTTREAEDAGFRRAYRWKAVRGD